MAYNIEHVEQDGKGRFFISLGDDEAHMTYQRVEPHVVLIDHTFVPPAHRGRDIAAELVTHGVKALAEKGDRIVPMCSYVSTMFARKKDWHKYLAIPGKD